MKFYLFSILKVFYNYYMEFKLFCAVLLLALCLGSYAQDKSEDKLIQIGQKITGSIQETDSNNTVVAIQVKEPYQSGFIFFNFQLPAQDFWKKTKLTVFNDEKQLLSCNENDKQVCYLETSKIKSNSLLAINIECQRGCIYTLATSIESVQQIIDGDLLTEQFDDSKIRLYRFKIPTLNEKQQAQFTIIPADTNNLPDRVKIYASTNGKLPNIYDSQFVSIPIWGGGQGLFFNKDQVSNKEILIMVVGKSDSDKFDLSARINENGEQEVTYGEYFHDYLAYNGEHILKLPLPEAYDNVYSLQFVIFEGQIQVGLFTDKQCKNLYKYKPILYRGSVKYIFSVNGTQQLYIQTKSKNSATTYNIILLLESRSNTAKIQDGVFTLANVHDQLFMYTSFQKNDQINNEDQYLFEMTAIQIKKSELDIKVHVCSSEFILGCFHHEKLDQNTVVEINDIDAKQQQRIASLKIKIDSTLLNNKKNLKYRKFILIIEYSNRLENQDAYFGLLIRDLNQIRFLKPKEHIFTALNLEQIKYFLFKNKNPDVSRIEVHFRALEGKGIVSLYRSDPRRDPTSKEVSIDDEYGSFNIVQNFNDPIYVKIQAKSQSSFLVNVLTFTAEQIQASKKMLVSTFQMKRAQQYTMYLPGLKDQTIMIPQQQNEITFNLKSNGKVSLCTLYSPQQACQIPQISAVMEKTFKKKSIDGNYYLKIVNLSPTKKITVSVQYKVEKTDQCVIHSLGKLYNDVLSNGRCIRFILPPTNDYEGFFMPAQITSTFPQFSVCDTKILTPAAEIKVSLSDLQKYCADKKQGFKYVDMSFNNPLDANKKLKAFYFFQASGQPLILPEGINFHDKVPSRPGLLKSYIYEVVNRNITSQIKLDRIQGKTTAFVNIVDLSQDNFKIPNMNNFKFKTQTNPNYYFDEQSTISVNSRHLDQANCQRCALLIGIYSEEKAQGEIVSYGVQVSQGVTNLNQHEPDHQFLTEGSIKYYQYQCKNNNKTVIFDISDNGMYCTRMSLGLQEYPNQKNRIDVSLDNHLEAQCMNNFVYYISVEAIKDCPVSIIAQSSDFKLTKLTQGIPLGIQLKAGQINYITFHHNSKGPFKIISVEEFGNVNFYVNPVTEEILGKISNDSLSDKEKNQIFKTFKIKNSYSNAIEIDEKNADYCDQCLYIGAIQAGDTDIVTSIIYLEDSEQLIMRAGKVLYDQLEINETSKIAYYDIVVGSLNVDVMDGTIRVSLIYGTHEETRITKQFSNSMQMQYVDYNYSPLIQDALKARQEGLHIVIQNIGNQIASFAISNVISTDPVTKALSIKKGIPLTLHMIEDVVCAQGFFPSKSEKVYISVDNQYISFLKDLDIQVYFDDEAHQLEGISETIENMIMITYDTVDGKDQSSKYMICFSNQVQKNSYVELTVLQSSKVNIIPPNTWGIMAGSEVFMFHPKKRFGLDILTCKGSSTFSFSGNYEQIMSNSTTHHQLDNIRDLTVSDETQKSHVLYFDTEDLTTFIKLDTGLSIVKWMDVDETTEEGLGYKKYGVGNFDFKATKNQLILTWGGLSAIAQTQMKIGQIEYEIYIAESEEQLRSAMHCSVQFPQNFFKSSFNAQQSQCQMSIKKSQIKSKFDQIQKQNTDSRKSGQIPNIHIGLAAKVKLLVNGTDGLPISDDYKFLYRPIEISEQLVLTDKESSNHTLLISIGALAIISLIAVMIVYVLLKKLVPLISRLRTRNMLIDEPVGQSSKPSMQQQDPGQSQKQIQNEEV